MLRARGQACAQRIAVQPADAAVGVGHQHGDTDGVADVQRRRRHARGYALLVVRHAGGRDDPHRGPDNALPDARDDQAGQDERIGCADESGARQRQRAGDAGHEARDQRTARGQPVGQTRPELRAEEDRQRRHDEGQPGLQGAVALHVLEQQRQEVRQRAKGAHEYEREDHAHHQAAVAEQPHRHQGVAAARLDHREGQQEHGGQRERREDGRGQPAVLRPLHQGIDQQRGPRRRRQRARHVEAAARGARGVLGNHQERRHDGDAGQQDVDEEHRRPAIGAGQHAAGQRTQRQAAGAGAAPDRQRAVARRAFLEQAVDQRQRGRKQQRGADALHRARDHDDRRVPGQPADQRRQRVQPQRADEHAPLAQQVDGAPAQQQKAAAEHRIGADHPLQGLFGKAQARADLRQGHEHDVDIQGVDELREGEQRQAPAQRTVGARGGKGRHAILQVEFDSTKTYVL